MATANITYPAFISYSSRDNQRWATWINEFHRVFADGLSAELSVEGIDSGPVFFDIDQLEGKTDTVQSNLENAINSSFALFIFVGKGYLDSEWCFRELKMFSQHVGSARDVLNKRVWIFELESLDESLKSRFEERLDRADASVLKNQRRQVFVDPATRKRPVLIRSDGKINQSEYQDKVEPLVKELAASIHAAPFQRRASQPKFDVVIAAPTRDLETQCQALATLLAAASLKCDRVTADDLDNLEDEQLRDRFCASKAVVLPVSAAKVYMRKAAHGGHLSTQLAALQNLDHGRIVIWRPIDVIPLQESEREWEDKHLPTVQSLLARAKCAQAAETLFEVLQPLMTAPVSPADVVVLCESKDDFDLLDDQVVAEISRNWPALSPTKMRDARVAYLKLDFETLRKNPRLVNGDAVIVFRDETEELTNSKCRIIARYMESWLRSPVPVQPGLIVVRDEESDTMIVHPWPKARFQRSQAGNPPHPMGAFSEKSQGSLKRFFYSIANLKDRSGAVASAVGASA